MLELVFLGDKAAGDELVEPLRALRPALDTIAMVPPAGIAERHMDPRDPMPYVGEGQLVRRLDAAVIDAFVAAGGPGSGSALVSAEIRHLGGALSRPQAGQGSLGTLDCEFMTFGVGVPAAPDMLSAHHRTLERIAAALAPYDTGPEYLNFTEARTHPGAVLPARGLPPAARRQGGLRPGQPVSRQPPHPARRVLTSLSLGWLS